MKGASMTEAVEAGKQIVPKTARRFGAVVRDFIPAGDKQTAVERARNSRLRSGSNRRVTPDFIPTADHETKPPSGHAEASKQAIERSLAAQASAARGDFDNVVQKLKGMNVAQTIEAITQAPFAVQEQMLIAEQMHGNRKSVLDRFGTPDPTVAARWKVILDGAPKEAEASTEAVEGAEEPSTPETAED